MPMVRACKRLTEPREKRSGHGSIFELCRHPTIPDTNGLATSRGMSIKFRLPDGSDTGIVAHSYVAFRRRVPPADPEPSSRFFLGSHPVAKTFLESQLPPRVRQFPRGPRSVPRNDGVSIAVRRSARRKSTARLSRTRSRRVAN